MSESPITQQGYERLQNELNHLKKVERPKITKAIASAREHGDLKENAEYHAARDQQGFNEARIRQLESVLSNAKIIDYMKLAPEDRIIFGATVTIMNLSTKVETTYQIVGVGEADIDNGKLSVTSPVAMGVIGKSLGEVVTIETPQGKIKYEIVEIEYI